MITIEVPHLTTIQAEHLVLDYNGTLAIDGMLIPEVKDKLNFLANSIQIHVITADTFKCADVNLKGIRCKLVVIGNENQHIQKERYIHDLGEKYVIAIGNGLNDSLMLKNAALGIALIQGEGASIMTIQSADIVCTGIIDALNLLLNPLRIIATLRK